LRAGGACETVQNDVTGVLVDDESAQGFAAGLSRVLGLRLDPVAIRTSAERYSRERFMTDFQAAVSSAIAERELAR
jgi:glycosyltransferase involved in cell wall biosynthesis